MYLVTVVENTEHVVVFFHGHEIPRFLLLLLLLYDSVLVSVYTRNIYACIYLL